ncbi:MAG: CoA transferase [Chloroflexi bacterium]|nr:CoA transferase [Chloroflexota bacterium]
MKEVLAGVRVLDFSRFRAGPTCGQILADMGADVIRVERPEGEEDRRIGPFSVNGQPCYPMFVNRNKRAVTLNLTQPKSRELLATLVRLSDVVIENFGPEVNLKLGLDYAALHRVRPDIVVVAISAFGQYGPYSKRRGFDGIAQAMSGIMAVTGFPGSAPLRAGVSFVDHATGVYAALGTMFALYHRQRTGEGQAIDISLLDVAIAFTDSIIAEYEVGQEVHVQLGNAHNYVGPYDAYRAKDGYFFVGSVGDGVWRSFCKVMGREDLVHDPRFATDKDRARPEGREFFTQWLNEWAAGRTVDEVVALFNNGGVPCARVNTVPEVAADRHVRKREMLAEVDHDGVKVPLLGIPFKLSRTPGQIKTTAPALGEHNEEVYRGLLGYSAHDLAKFREESVV